MDRDDIIQRLCSTYQQTPQVGLVVGAGVSKESRVPLYPELALALVELACQEQGLLSAPEEAIEFLRARLLQWRSGRKRTIDLDPGEVLQFIRDHVDSKHTPQRLQRLVKTVLYGKVDVDPKNRFKMVHSSVYRNNRTLDAIISFCAAAPGSPLAPHSQEPRWDTNPKVGGILTTNYDNLVEGAFGSKYRKSLLKPVAREGARESDPRKPVIPVYHMHGYVSYVHQGRGRDGIKASELVLAEQDYYDTFYNHLGFSNVVAMSFLRRFPSIFVGCSMVDKNLRRILYHLRRDRIISSDIKEHYAILPFLPQREAAFHDAVLRSFGVSAIRVDPRNMGAEVEAILKRVYVSAEGVSEEHWSQAKRGTRSGLAKSRRPM
jgi:hypothetical protein